MTAPHSQSTEFSCTVHLPSPPRSGKRIKPLAQGRWLRKPAFKAALDSIREALRFNAEFYLAIGASRAAQTLGTAQQAALTSDDVKTLSELLRHAHLRQRFPTDAKLASPATFKLRDKIKELEETAKTLREERQHHKPRDLNEQDEDDGYERDLNQELQRLKALVSSIPPRQGSTK
jgi:crotonobetainyl-CoA:carnitine CoA-transferase CaiB-like acyl-CoA transferase